MSVVMHIKRARLSSALPRWNHRRRTPLRDGFDQRIGIVRLVRHDSLCRNARHQCLGLRDIVRVTSRQGLTRQLPQAFDHRVNLGGQSAARAAEGLLPVFFAAPAACW